MVDVSGGADEQVQPWRQLSRDERLKWAGAVAPAVVVDRERHLVVVSTTCPACGHGFTSTASGPEGRVVIGWSPRSRASDVAWSGELRFTIACSCRSQHPGRPSGIERGCGASGPLKDVE
jgi:hypothetical protein